MDSMMAETLAAIPIQSFALKGNVRSRTGTNGDGNRNPDGIEARDVRNSGNAECSEQGTHPLQSLSGFNRAMGSTVIELWAAPDCSKRLLLH